MCLSWFQSDVWSLLSEAVCSQLQSSVIQMCSMSVSTWPFGIKSSITVKHKDNLCLLWSHQILLPSQSQSSQAAPLQAWSWWCSLWKLVGLVFWRAWHLPQVCWTPPHRTSGYGHSCCPPSRSASVAVAAPLSLPLPTEEEESCCLELEEPTGTELGVSGWNDDEHLNAGWGENWTNEY